MQLQMGDHMSMYPTVRQQTSGHISVPTEGNGGGLYD